MVDLCQRIAVLTKYERIVMSLSGWQWLKRMISIFPHIVPRGKIIIRPNKSNEILTFPSLSLSRDVNTKIDIDQDQELQMLNNKSSLEKTVPSRSIVKLEKYSTMDPKIMKAIRRVLDEKKDKSQQDAKDDKALIRIKGLESQIKILTDAIMKMKN